MTKRGRGRPRKSAPPIPVQLPAAEKQRVIVPSVLRQPTISQNWAGNEEEPSEIVIDTVLSQEEKWVVVQRKKKKKQTNDKQWTKQQKDNFCHTGDVFKERPNGNQYQLHSGSAEANINEALQGGQLQDIVPLDPVEEIQFELFENQFDQEEDAGATTSEDETSGDSSNGQQYQTGSDNEEVQPPEQFQAQAGPSAPAETAPRGTATSSHPVQPPNIPATREPRTFLEFLTSRTFGPIPASPQRPHTRSRGPASPEEPPPQKARRGRKPP